MSFPVKTSKTYSINYVDQMIDDIREKAENIDKEEIAYYIMKQEKCILETYKENKFMAKTISQMKNLVIGKKNVIVRNINDFKRNIDQEINDIQKVKFADILYEFSANEFQYFSNKKEICDLMFNVSKYIEIIRGLLADLENENIKMRNEISLMKKIVNTDLPDFSIKKEKCKKISK